MRGLLIGVLMAIVGAMTLVGAIAAYCVLVLAIGIGATAWVLWILLRSVYQKCLRIMGGAR